MKIAFGGEEGLALSPEQFTDEDVAAAIQAGAKLEKRFSKTVQAAYMANVCGKCDAITGSFYLHDYWHLASSENQVLSKLVCSKCQRKDPEKEIRKEVSFISLGELLPPRPKSRLQVHHVEKIVSPKPPLVWGSCGGCGAAACPRVLKDGLFFCSDCGAQKLFVPD